MLQEKTIKALAKIQKPTEILVFMAPGCPYCKGVVQIAGGLAAENENIVLKIVDATKNPKLVERYRVMSTPKTIINGEIALGGAIKEEELLDWIVKAQSPGFKKEYLCNRLESGEAERVAQMAGEDEGLVALLGEAVGCSAMQARLGAMVALEEIQKKDRGLVRPAVPKIIALLGDSSPLIRNDAAYALGFLGDSGDILHLEKLLEDSDTGVIKTARKSIANLKKAAP